MFEPINWTSICRPYAIACWLLTGLFVPLLLAAEAFQDLLPYWLSLSVQAALLAGMAGASWRLQRGLLAPNPRLGRLLARLGAAYMIVAIAGIASGLTLEAALWSRMRIPALMHVVLAGFVLTISLYHRRERVPGWYAPRGAIGRQCRNT
jgi:hypothetical protein